MKKISLLMLTLLLSVVSFAQKPATGQKAEVYPGPESLPVYMVPASSGFEKEAYTAPWRTRRAFSGDVITDQPEGTLKTYVRSGSYANANGNIRSQTGFAYIVFANDGKTVWFKDLVSYNLSTWVKGTIDGNTITVPLGQPIANLDPTYGTAVLGITYPTSKVSVSGNLTFTMTEKTITLDYYTNYTIGMVGGCFEYGGTVYGLKSLGLNYGVYATVFTLFEEPEVVTPPDGLSTTDMPLTASENGSTDYNATVKVGWAGNDVYIQGINKYLPEAWVKGSLNEEGTKVTFPVQYMGKDTKTPYYLTGYSSKGNMPDVTMDYDADTKTFTGNGTIIINSSATAFSYVVFYNGLIIGTPPTPIVVPDGLETKSYAMAGLYTEDGETQVDIAEDYTVKIGVAEGVYYIQGLLPNVPAGWVQGTLADGKLTIPAGQYVGKDTKYGIGQYIVAGTNDAIEDIVLDYDATNDKFTTTSVIYTSNKKKSINWYLAINSGAIIGTRSAVNIADGIENGTIAVDKPKAFTGDVVTVTATPAEGYELDAITVKGADESAIEVSAENTFVMPAQAVTVSATFKKLPADVTVEAADITDGDITAAITAKAAGAPVKNLTINLAAGDYKVTAPLVAGGNIAINGTEGAVIDASANTTGAFIQMSATPAVAANEQSAYPIDGITIKDVKINGLAQSLVDGKAAIYYMKGITIENSVINVSGNKHIIDFYQKGLAEVLSIKNSTLWASDASKHTGRLYQQQSGKKPAEVGAAQLKVSITNSTLYNICNNQNYVGYYRENSKSYHSFEVLNSVIVNCATSGNFVKSLNQKQLGASSTWNVDGNIFNYGGADTSSDEVKNSATGVVKNSVAGVVTFTSTETPDFGGNVALSWGAEMPTSQVGDPRWTLTYSQKGIMEDGKYFIMGLSYDNPQQWLGGGKLSDFGVEFTATFDATALTYTLQNAEGKYLQSDLTLGETAFGWTVDADAVYGQNIYTKDGDTKKYIGVNEEKNLVLTETYDATCGWGFFPADYFWAALAPRVIVGSTDLTGTAEAYQADIKNAMVLNETTGLWEKTFKLVEVTEEKQPEFKVALNGDAAKAYPAEARKITLADFGSQTTAGLYNITISYNDEGNVVNVSGIKAEPEDVVVNAAAIAEVYGDINAAVEKAEKGKLVKSLTINLGNELQYTVSKPIVATGSVTINGNGSTIDASLLTDAFIKMSDAPIITPDEKGAMKVDAININGVKISGLKYQLFFANKQKYLIGKMIVENSVIGIDGTNKKTVFDFKGGGLAEDLTINKSTIWANPTNAVNGGLYSTESGSKIADLGATKNEITITNSTLYNIANGKPVSTLRQNSQNEQKYTVKNNIIVNCGATSNGLGQFLKGLNARQAGKDANWDVDGNVINYGKNCIAEDKVGSSEENIKNAVPAIALFADADQGDFNVSFVKDPKVDLAIANVGDPRWTIGATTDAYMVEVLESIEHATVTVDKSFSLADELITITVVPEQGYKVKKVIVKVGNTNLKAEQPDPAKDVFTFTMPAMNVTIGAEMEMVATDFVINVESGNITNAINKEIKYTEGEEVKTKIVTSLTVNLKKAGTYTITESISCGGGIVVNGVKDAVIDASALTTPFIAMSQTPVVEPVASGQYVITAPIAVKNVTITGLDNALIADGGVAYAFDNVTVENCVVEALQTKNYTFDFSKSMPINFNIKNSTLYSKVATSSKNFMSISGQQPSKITGYEGGKFEFINNTFYNCATTKQFINTNSIKGKGNVNRVWKNNIFVDCGNKQIWDKFDNGNSPREVENNTYWYNGQNAGEKYDTDVLQYNPYLKDAANGDFAVGYKTEQAEKKTGDQRWGTWENVVYTITIAEMEGGTIEAPAIAEADEEIQLVAKPAEGFRLKAGSVYGMMGKSEFEISENLTFFMPVTDVTIYAEFEPVYAVNIAEGIENGTVKADVAEAGAGDVVTLTITPADGYELEAVTVTGVTSDIVVEVTDGKFTMPADAVTVNATFKSTTGINGVKADALKDAQIYNLQGVRVDKAQKGLYIVNGRKVVIK